MVRDIRDRGARRARLGLSGDLERPGDFDQLRQLRHDIDELLWKMRRVWAPLAERLAEAGRPHAAWLLDELDACRRDNDSGTLFAVSLALSATLEPASGPDELTIEDRGKVKALLATVRAELAELEEGQS